MTTQSNKCSWQQIDFLIDSLIDWKIIDSEVTVKQQLRDSLSDITPRQKSRFYALHSAGEDKELKKYVDQFNQDDQHDCGLSPEDGCDCVEI